MINVPLYVLCSKPLISMFTIHVRLHVPQILLLPPVPPHLNLLNIRHNSENIDQYHINYLLFTDGT